MTEADICERYGWTYSQLDEEDGDRVMTGYTLQNVRGGLGRIKSWLQSSGKIQISPEDLALYSLVENAKNELEAEK